MLHYARLVAPRPGTPAPAPSRPAPPGVAPAAAPPPLAHSAAWRLAGAIARVLLGLVSVPVFTAALGMWQWGLLALFQAAAAPLVVLDLGAGAAAVKRVAECLGRGDTIGAARAVHTTFLFHLGMAAIGVALLAALAGPLATHVFAIPPEQHAIAVRGFRLVAVSSMIALAGSSFLGVLRATQRFDSVTKLSTLGALATTGAGLAAALAQTTVLGVLVAQALATAFVAVLTFRSAAKLLPELRRRPRWDRASFEHAMSFGSWHALAVGGNLLSSWSDRYVLGARFAPSAIGFYAVAHSLYFQLYTAFYELGEVLFPAVSHSHGAGDLGHARRLSLLVGWTITTAFGVAAATLAVLGGDFLRLWISPEAESTATALLRLLCVAGALSTAALAPSFYLLGVGRTRWHATSTLLSGAAALAVALALPARTGIEAVAWGLVAGGGVRLALTGFVWRAHFAPEITLREFAMHLWAPPIASVVLIALVPPAHDAIVHARSWIGLLGEIAITAIVVGSLQLAAGELLPGGGARRTAVIRSFAPLLRISRP